MCQDAPDTTKQQEAAMLSSQMSADQWAYSKDTLIPYYMDRQQKLDDITAGVTSTQLGIQRDLADQGRDLYDYNKATFRPAEQSLVAQAMQDSTPEAYQRYASGAAARTGMAFTNAMSAAERDLRSRGVSAGSAAGVSASRQAALSSALAGGQAFNGAYDAAEARGWARKVDAVGLGRNLAGASTGAYSAATGAGASAFGINNDASRTAGSTVGTATQYQQMAGSNNNNAAATYGNIAATQAAADPTKALLGAAGTAAGMYFASDKGVKRGVRRVAPSTALEGINDTEVSSWQYKPGTKGDDGEPLDGETHVGAMAQDIAKHLGPDVAPGGVRVDRAKLHGRKVEAVAELAARVKALQRELATLGS